MNEEIKHLLTTAKTIAVVGLSSNPQRASHGVARFLQAQGYRVIPVNPKETEVLGEKAYASLDEVPEAVDIVNVFREPSAAPAIVEAAIGKGARAVWMQQGVVHEQAAERARQAGLVVVMDRCILQALQSL